jgi:hypothetical protein
METDDTLDIEDTIVLNDIITNTNGAQTPLGEEDIITITDSSVYGCGSDMFGSMVGVDTITLSDSTITNGGIYSINPSSYGAITLSAPSYTTGNISLNGSSIYQSQSIQLGDTDANKQKIYIVEPWQSTKPMHIEDNLWVSLEKDLLSTKDLKKKIMDKLEESNPEILIKMGINPDNMKLVRNEVNLEINRDLEK